MRYRVLQANSTLPDFTLPCAAAFVSFMFTLKFLGVLFLLNHAVFSFFSIILLCNTRKSGNVEIANAFFILHSSLFFRLLSSIKFSFFSSSTSTFTLLLHKGIVAGFFVQFRCKINFSVHPLQKAPQFVLCSQAQPPLFYYPIHTELVLVGIVQSFNFQHFYYSLVNSSNKFGAEWEYWNALDLITLLCNFPDISMHKRVQLMSFGSLGVQLNVIRSSGREEQKNCCERRKTVHEGNGNGEEKLKSEISIETFLNFVSGKLFSSLFSLHWIVCSIFLFTFSQPLLQLLSCFSAAFSSRRCSTTNWKFQNDLLHILLMLRSNSSLDFSSTGKRYAVTCAVDVCRIAFRNCSHVKTQLEATAGLLAVVNFMYCQNFSFRCWKSKVSARTSYSGRATWRHVNIEKIVKLLPFQPLHVPHHTSLCHVSAMQTGTFAWTSPSLYVANGFSDGEVKFWHEKSIHVKTRSVNPETFDSNKSKLFDVNWKKNWR